MAPKPMILCAVDLTLAPEARGILERDSEVLYCPPNRASVLELIPGCDAFWTHMNLKTDGEVLDRGDRLRVIATATTGTDHVDVKELKTRGIRLLSIASDHELLRRFTATAECAFLLLLACSRNARSAVADVLEGHWAGEKFTGHQLFGRTIGVVGLGRLGEMACAIAKGFGMRVLGCDRVERHLAGVDCVSFSTLLEEADCISVHIHLDEANYHLFDERAFARMKKGTILINTSRGDIVKESALLEALESGTVTAFGADVVHDEWRADMRESPLVRYAASHDNVIITPHIGGATIESIVEARVFMAKKLIHFLQFGLELRYQR